MDIYVISASGGTAAAGDDLSRDRRDRRAGRETGASSTLGRTGMAQVAGVEGARRAGRKRGTPGKSLEGAGSRQSSRPTDGTCTSHRECRARLDPQNALWRIPVEGGDEEVVVEGIPLLASAAGT